MRIAKFDKTIVVSRRIVLCDFFPLCNGISRHGRMDICSQIAHGCIHIACDTVSLPFTLLTAWAGCHRSPLKTAVAIRIYANLETVARTLFCPIVANACAGRYTVSGTLAFLSAAAAGYGAPLETAVPIRITAHLIAAARTLFFAVLTSARAGFRLRSTDTGPRTAHPRATRFGCPPFINTVATVATDLKFCRTITASRPQLTIANFTAHAKPVLTNGSAVARNCRAPLETAVTIGIAANRITCCPRTLSLARFTCIGTRRTCIHLASATLTLLARSA